MIYIVTITIDKDGAVTTNIKGPTGGDFDGNLKKMVSEISKTTTGGKKTNKKHKKTNKNIKNK